MNWTGGNLQRHSKSNPNKATKSQQLYFAKTKLQSRIPARVPSPLQFHAFTHKDAHLQAHPIISDETSAHEQSKCGDSKSKQRPRVHNHEKVEVRHNKCPIDRTAGSQSRVDGEIAVHSKTSSEQSFDHVRRSLLYRTDWLGVSAAQPLKIAFPSVASMEKIGRHRRMASNAEAAPTTMVRPRSRDVIGTKYTHADHPPDRPFQGSDSNGVRVGSNNHYAQDTIRPSSHRSITPAHRASGTSSTSMLLEPSGRHDSRNGNTDIDRGSHNLPTSPDDAVHKHQPNLLLLSDILSSSSFDEIRGRSKSSIIPCASVGRSFDKVGICKPSANGDHSHLGIQTQYFNSDIPAKASDNKTKDETDIVELTTSHQPFFQFPGNFTYPQPQSNPKTHQVAGSAQRYLRTLETLSWSSRHGPFEPFPEQWEHPKSGALTTRVSSPIGRHQPFTIDKQAQYDLQSCDVALLRQACASDGLSKYTRRASRSSVQRNTSNFAGETEPYPVNKLPGTTECFFPANPLQANQVSPDARPQQQQSPIQSFENGHNESSNNDEVWDRGVGASSGLFLPRKPSSTPSRPLTTRSRHLQNLYVTTSVETSYDTPERETESFNRGNSAWMKYVFPEDEKKAPDGFKFATGNLEVVQQTGGYRQLTKPSHAIYDLDLSSSTSLDNCIREDSCRYLPARESIRTGANTSIFSREEHNDTGDQKADTDILSQINPMEGILDERIARIPIHNNPARGDRSIASIVTLEHHSGSTESHNRSGIKRNAQQACLNYNDSVVSPLPYSPRKSFRVHVPAHKNHGLENSSNACMSILSSHIGQEPGTSTDSVAFEKFDRQSRFSSPNHRMVRGRSDTGQCATNHGLMTKVAQATTVRSLDEAHANASSNTPSWRTATLSCKTAGSNVSSHPDTHPPHGFHTSSISDIPFHKHVYRFSSSDTQWSYRDEDERISRAPSGMPGR